MVIRLSKTDWIGIYIMSDNGYFWIIDDNGGEKFIRPLPPTAAQLLAYRTEVVR